MSDESSVERPSWPRWVEDWVLPYVRESALWPVWAAVMGHVVLVFALAVLEVWRGNGFVALVVSVGITVGVSWFEVRVRGRPGALVLSLTLTWLVAAGIVAIAIETNFI